MRTFLARCTMLGLLVGGFALTGDAGWIVAKGQSLLNATTVPSAADLWGGREAAPPVEPAADFAAASQPTAPFAPAPADMLPPASTPPSQPAAGNAPHEHPVGAAAGPVEVQVTPSLAAPLERPPLGGGEPAVDLRLLRPGDRVRLWVNGSTVAFDIVDPATGEAIQQPVTRRVRISGAGDPHRIERGGMIVVQPRPGISGYQPPAETVGPVQAVQL